MRGFLFLAVFTGLFPAAVQGAVPEDTVDKLDSVVVMASRAGSSTPVTYTMIFQKSLKEANPINSLPMTLAYEPSVVAITEGGTGLGYSRMTIRGLKGAQVNVTLNGVTLNDAESQEVFWVNIPALSNLLSSVQLQRGLGTSSAGPGAFGANVNMSTASVRTHPYAGVDLGYGSYNTFTATASAGTGLTKCGLFADAAYSQGFTDGYIRNAYADVRSAYAVIGWMNEKNSLRAIWLYGEQHSGITWNGIDLSQYQADRRFNSAGMYYDALGNIRYYDNETDNYKQHHLQLNYTRSFGESLLWTTTFNYTRGDGYFENYKNAYTSDYFGFSDSFSGDFIVREALANDYFVINSDLRYKSRHLNVTFGVNLSRYDGDHIGKVLWSDVLGDKYDYQSHNWYLNNGLKQEVNVYARAEYMPLDWLTAYLDLQYRGIRLDMRGPEYGVSLDYSAKWHFFNPRAGLSFQWNPKHKIYASVAHGNREPGRADIKAYIDRQSEDVGLKPEKMLDFEAGYSYLTEKFSLSANIYMMEYWDMLLETGKLSNVGYAIKDNVDRGWRRGVEFALGWQPLNWLRVDANLSLSVNKIKDYKVYLDNINYIGGEMNWTGGQKELVFGKTTMLMSPSVTSMARLAFSPWKGRTDNSLKTLTLAIDGKYVGRQYLDNTMTEASSVPGYFVMNLSLSHEFDLKKGKLGLSAYINNLLNHKYYADGWAWNVYNTETGQVESYPGIYPQPSLNFMLKVAYRF